MTLRIPSIGELPVYTGSKSITGALMVGTGIVLSAGAIRVPAGLANPVSLGIDDTVTGFYKSDTNKIGVSCNGTRQMQLGDNGLQLLQNGLWLGWGTTLHSPDLVLYRDGANDLAQRNGGTAQKSSIYGSYTSSSVYERLRFLTAAGDYSIAPEAAGGGTLRGLVLGGSGGRLGFLGSPAVALQTITGSRLASPALADLLTKLATIGLIVDGSVI